jgi:hypothetical protein
MTRQVAMTGTLLLLLGASMAEGQTGSATLPGGPNRKPKPNEGTVRQLVCRGTPSLQLTRRPDFDHLKEVAIVMTYSKNPRPAGLEYQQLDPGACTWNPVADPASTHEPGLLQFYLAREGSAWIPDTVTFRTYLSDPSHYWVFYVNDLTYIAYSHGAFGGQFYVAERRGNQARTSLATALRREELRCRGGAGLAFARGQTVGDNLVRMTLAYAVAGAAAGDDGRGLGAGTCAWVNRDDARREPGRVAFITPANAQLRQIQSGSPVDRSTTAAEHFADALTIPPYMADPRHYWSFMVSLADPDSARSHAVWKPSLTDILTSAPPATSPTTVSQPVIDAGSGTTATPSVDGTRDAAGSTTRSGSVVGLPR